MSTKSRKKSSLIETCSGDKYFVHTSCKRFSTSFLGSTIDRFAVMTELPRPEVLADRSFRLAAKANHPQLQMQTNHVRSELCFQ